MSLIINHNISALNTHRNIVGSGQSMAKSIEKLSSGYKINVGADDPSGLIISEQLRSQISGLERAVRNSSEAFNLIGIAEGALNEMNTILKKMRALAIHAANSGVTSPEQVAADQSEMDSGIETLNRIANTTRYSDQYLLNGQKQLVYDVTTSVNEPTDHSLLDTKMTRIDQVFKRDGVKMSIGFTGEKNQYQANTDTSAQRAYLEADNAYSLSEIDGANITSNQEFILTGTSGSRLFSFSAGAHLGEVVSGINNVRDSTGIGASLIFASDVRIDQTINGTPNGSSPNYQTGTQAESVKGYDDGTYIYRNGDVQIYNAGLNNTATAKISEFTLTPDAASAFKVGFNTDGDGKIYAKVVDKSTNSIEYYKDKNCTMLIGKGDDTFFSATNNSGIPSSPVQSLDGIYMKLNTDNAEALDVYEIAVIGQRLDNQKDMAVSLAGWSDTANSVMSGVNLGVNTSAEGGLFYEYVPLQFEADGETVKTFEINVYMHETREPKYLVATSGIVQNNMKIADPKTGQLAGQTVRIESVVMDDGADSGLNITINLPQAGALDGVTGLTVDELKEDPLYKQVMADLKIVRGEYNEIAGEYTGAVEAREKALGELGKAQTALDAARKEEARVRREVDRLEARDLDQQKLDARRDLDLAKNDMYVAARNAMYADTLKDAYTNVGIASPGSTERINDQLVGKVLDRVKLDTDATPPRDPADIDWAAEKNAITDSVWLTPPLNAIRAGMTVDEVTAIEKDVNSLLSAAYDAATGTKLVQEVGDAAVFVDELDDLETNLLASRKLLTDTKPDFDDAVAASMAAAGDEWAAAAFDSTEIGKLADGLKTALVKYMDDLPYDAANDFTDYNWDKAKAEVTAAVTGSYKLVAPATAARVNAVVSDMFDSFVTEPAVKAYGTAAQKLAANPAPDMTKFTGKIDTEALNAVNGVKNDFLTPGTNAKIDLITNWVNAPATAYGWGDLAGEISKIIADEINVNPYTVADLSNPASAMTAVQNRVTTATAPTYPALAAALATGGAGLSATGTDNEAALDELVSLMWTDATGPGTAALTFVQEGVAHDAADTAQNLALANVGTTSLTTEFDGYTAALDAMANEAVGASPTQEIADAFSAGLIILAQEGVAIPGKLSDPLTKELMIENIVAAIPAAIAETTGEAMLKQMVTDVYTHYIAQAGDGVGVTTDGNAADYSELVTTYVGYETTYSGGAIKRAEDRLERYADRLEAAPLKAYTSATTRKPWQRLDNVYGADAQLTKLAKDFGEYARKLVESRAAAGTEDSIIWNSSDVNNPAVDVHDWLMNEMKIGATAALWDDIQAQIKANPDVGNAALDDLNKIVEKMFETVTEPDYNEDVATAGDPEPPVPGEYVFRSPAKKYFDQYDTVQALQAELEAKEIEKETLDDQITDLTDLVANYDVNGDGTSPDGDLVLDLRDANHEYDILSQEADPLLDRIAELEQQAKDWLAAAGGGKGFMPPGNQEGQVTFKNLGMRIFAVDYGSAETIRIQNKAGNLFYQYRESDSMEKLMVEPDKTVQVAGQDAQIALNGAPVFTTGLIADTTTPDFSGSLVFNAGVLGETTLAIAGYDTGKLFSKATALQGVEENEAEITELRRHFEPPAMTVPMGDKMVKPAEGMLNKNGNPVNFYMDFSQLDPSVEVKIDNFGNACPIKVSFTAPDQLTINADSLGTDPDNVMNITLKVNPENLNNGYYVTEPALKGLFIKTDDLVDLNMSGESYTPAVTPTTTPEAGNTMLEVNTYATNPRSNTSESLENFLGGMQFQLGNTEGDQDRTVYSIQSMAMSELGRISWNGAEYCLQNVLGGGVASLSKDPILAMRILEQAVDDVSTLRARLGAFQSNMLQSNINSLGVAIENITKTESAIRDTDMAEESTQFTRFQIMQNAGTSMLAQANQVSQNVLTLLQ